MDRIGLEILHQELLADAKVLQEAARAARERLILATPSSLESCGYQLNRFYNVLERSFQNVCESFENHFEKRGDYHEKLIQRMALNLPGVRPAFLSYEDLDGLRELKGFRHIFRHAYDLTLKPDRLESLVSAAETIALSHLQRIEWFTSEIRSNLKR